VDGGGYARAAVTDGNVGADPPYRLERWVMSASNGEQIVQQGRGEVTATFAVATGDPMAARFATAIRPALEACLDLAAPLVAFARRARPRGRPARGSVPAFLHRGLMVARQGLIEHPFSVVVDFERRALIDPGRSTMPLPTATLRELAALGDRASREPRRGPPTPASEMIEQIDLRDDDDGLELTANGGFRAGAAAKLVARLNKLRALRERP
jgi:hypothetical protein